MAWILYALSWLAIALFWTLAAAYGSNHPPLDVLPYGIVAMSIAGIMGVGVWRLTGRVRWNSAAVRFYLTHALALTIYSVSYSAEWILIDLVSGGMQLTEVSLRVASWNLLMGSWLYLVVAGLSYAIRAHRRIHAEEVAAAEARVLANQAQLNALRAQVNPHFLFNALHTIGALIPIDPARADRALEALGDLLRYALGTEQKVPFGQEWRFTQDYLNFEQLRLGDRLKVMPDLDEAAMSVEVPPLILQPVVENAVRHGIGNRERGGVIEIQARIEAAGLCIRVTDDGAGDGEVSREGVGLASIRRRLGLTYGDVAALRIDRLPQGVRVEIRVPQPIDKRDDD